MPADPLAPLLELPGVAAGVDRARAAVDTMLGHRVLRRRSPDVSAESALRGAWASASLAGRQVSLPDVRSGAAADDPVVQGALRAQSAIGALTDTWSWAPRQALARLHALAAADLVDEYRLITFPVVVGVGDHLFATGTPADFRFTLAEPADPDAVTVLTVLRRDRDPRSAAVLSG